MCVDRGAKVDPPLTSAGCDEEIPVVMKPNIVDFKRISINVCLRETLNPSLSRRCSFFALEVPRCMVCNSFRIMISEAVEPFLSPLSRWNSSGIPSFSMPTCHGLTMSQPEKE